MKTVFGRMLRIVFVIAVIVGLGMGMRQVLASSSPVSAGCPCKDNDDCDPPCCEFGGVCLSAGQCLCQ